MFFAYDVLKRERVENRAYVSSFPNISKIYNVCTVFSQVNVHGILDNTIRPCFNDVREILYNFLSMDDTCTMSVTWPANACPTNVQLHNRPS